MAWLFIRNEFVVQISSFSLQTFGTSSPSCSFKCPCVPVSFSKLMGNLSCSFINCRSCAKLKGKKLFPFPPFSIVMIGFCQALMLALSVILSNWDGNICVTSQCVVMASLYLLQYKILVGQLIG